MNLPASQPPVRVRVWRDGNAPEDIPPQELPRDLPEDMLVWVDLLDPGPDVLAGAVAQFGLDPHAVEDAVSHHERPKLTRRPGHLFLTVYATRLDGDVVLTHRSRMAVSKISAFLLPRAVVTIRSGTPFPIEEVLARWEDAAHALARAAAEVRSGILVHGLLDVVVDGHFETIQLLDDALENLEDLLFGAEPHTRGVQQAVYRFRKELVQLRRVVLPVREVVGGLLRHENTVLSADHGSASGDPADPRRSLEAMPAGRAALLGDLEDLYDHSIRAAEWTESLRDMITSAFETNLTLQDARLNTVMKKLASWAAIIAVPTAVTGWFGQNVPHPGYGAASGLWLSVAAVCVGSLGLYALFKHRDWL